MKFVSVKGCKLIRSLRFILLLEAVLFLSVLKCSSGNNQVGFEIHGVCVMWQMVVIVALLFMFMQLWMWLFR